MAEEVIETGELDQLRSALARERQETSSLLSQELLLRRELMEYQAGELRELRSKVAYYEEAARANAEAQRDGDED